MFTLAWLRSWDWCPLLNLCARRRLGPMWMAVRESTLLNVALFLSIVFLLCLCGVVLVCCGSC
jgi:hypothetical protein